MVFGFGVVVSGIDESVAPSVFVGVECIALLFLATWCSSMCGCEHVESKCGPCIDGVVRA